MTIGIVKTDDLPSTSIGLRVSEMKRLGFDSIVLYTKTRISIAKQFDGCTVATSEKQLRDALSIAPGKAVVDSRYSLDKDCINVLGNPPENEIRCLIGSSFTGTMEIGDRTLVKAIEYDRRRGSIRYTNGDLGDIQVDTIDTKGPFVLTTRTLLSLLNGGDGFMKGGAQFQKATASLGISTVCVDPKAHGIRWESSISQAEKKTSSLVYGERPFPKTASSVNAKAPETVRKKGTDGSLPVLSIVFQTHNRTATACFCLDALCKNLEYAGRVHYCICDDRSYDGHIGALVRVLRSNRVDSFSVHTTSDRRWGLGASINNGLDWSFKFTDSVLTIEDDFLLRKKFDITEYVKELMKPDVAGIKLAANMEAFNPVVYSGHDGFKKVIANTRNPMAVRYTFNNLVMLRHRRVFDKIGKYDENVVPEVMEVDALVRFNRKFENGMSDELKILWPNRLKLNTYDTEWFVHIGRSTLGHTSGMDTAKPYTYLTDERVARSILDESGKYFGVPIHIVIPCYNNPALLDRCLKSIAAQRGSPRIMATVVDDCSDPEVSLAMADTVCRYDFTVFMPMHDKGMAGGARNLALDESPVNSAYTMFLDSDDELAGSDALKNVYDALESNGFPDMLCLSYVSSTGTHIAKETSPSTKCTIAPWSRCVKTKLVSRFIGNRRMCNDTVQYLRTIDTVHTVASTDKVIVKYNSDSPNSGWSSNNVRTSRAGMEGMFMTILDILDEKMDRESTRKAARIKLDYIEKNAIKSLSQMKERI